MSRPGWNPSRRNRNIGTSRAGHGQDNRLVIPARWSDDRVFWQKLRDPVVVTRAVDEREVVVLVEPAIEGYTHCCTPEDVLRMVGLLAPEDLGDLRLFVLRQPTRKEATLSPVWARLAYFADLGAFTGPAVYLEAQELGKIWRQRASMSVDDQREFERLVADGHRPQRVGGRHHIQLALDACRNTQLYRSLLHEVGHQVDYVRSVEQPRARLADAEDPGWDAIGDRYWRKPTLEKEVFAHRYADDAAARLRTAGAIPFERAVDPTSLTRAGLDPAWFSEPC